VAKSIHDCQTPEELAEAIAYHLKQGGMRRNYYDETGLRETKFDEFETKRLYGVALNKYNEIRKLYPNLPALQIATSDSLSGLAQIQQLCTSKQESLQEIIDVLKNWQKSEKTDKDFKDTKSALPPIAKTYEILCRSRGQCGAKTTDLIKWLGSAAKDRSGYYPALLNSFASSEVIADLEKWQEKPTEIEQDTKKELGEMHKWYQTNIFKFVVIPVVIPLVVALFLGIPSWLSLGNKTDHSQTASTNIFAYVSRDGSILRSNNFLMPRRYQ